MDKFSSKKNNDKQLSNRVENTDPVSLEQKFLDLTDEFTAAYAEFSKLFNFHFVNIGKIDPEESLRLGTLLNKMSNELIDKLELQSSLLDEMFGLQNNSDEVEITDEELREIEKWYEERFDNNDEQEKSGGFGR